MTAVVVGAEPRGWRAVVVAAVERVEDVVLVHDPPPDADVVLDLTPDGVEVGPVVTVLRPEPAELDEHAVLRLLAARATTLRVAVVARRDGRTWTAAESTIKLARFSARATSSSVAARVGELAVRALRSLDDEPPDEQAFVTPPLARPTPASVARFALAGVASLVRSRATTIEWRVSVGEADVNDPLRIPQSLRTLAAPPGRFYADPFLAQAGGRTVVFVEDFDVRAGHASISAVDVASGATAPVLATGSHLSYPFVFEDGGDWYLVPESAAARNVVLYRCESFPDRWAPDSVFFDGVEAYDTTLLRRDGLWWLFYASGTAGSALDDELHVWFSPSLRGPYAPHPRNPVKSTVYGSRPAGPFLEIGGRLLRPGQDGSSEYGSGIVVHEVERLTTTEYRETPVRELRGSLLGAHGVHTISLGGGLVAVDTKHRPLRRLRSA